jgi:hypothetical protein
LGSTPWSARITARDGVANRSHRRRRCSPIDVAPTCGHAASRRRATLHSRRPPPKSGILTISSAATDRTPDLEWNVLSDRGMCGAGSGTNVTARGLGDGAPARNMRALCSITSAPRRASKTCRYRGPGSGTILVRIVASEVCPTHPHAAEGDTGRHLELRQDGDVLRIRVSTQSRRPGGHAGSGSRSSRRRSAGSEPSRRPCASEAA